MTLPLPYQLDTALKHLDSLFPLFPEFDSFKVEDILQTFNNSNTHDKIPPELRSAFERLLKDKLEYLLIHPQFNLRFELTKLGREVKEAGGHFSYLQKVAEKTKTEKERQRLADEKMRYDIGNAKRIFKTYWLTFTLSLLAFLLSLGKIIFDIIKAK